VVKVLASTRPHIAKKKKKKKRGTKVNQLNFFSNIKIQENEGDEFSYDIL
jgi:hypothetical protein